MSKSIIKLAPKEIKRLSSRIKEEEIDFLKIERSFDLEYYYLYDIDNKFFIISNDDTVGYAIEDYSDADL